MQGSLLLAAASGLLQILVFPSFNLFLLAPIAVVPLLVAAAREDPWRRFFAGWLAGSIYWAGTCYWIYGVMHRYADLPAWAAALIFVGFFLVKGLHLGAFSLLAAPMLTRWIAIPAVAGLWVAVEGSHQYLGFTWLQLGNSGVAMPALARLAPYAGVYGVSFVLAMINTALAVVWLRRPLIHLAWLTLLFNLYLLPPLPEARNGSERARLVQPNIHPDELTRQRWTRKRHRDHLARMEELSRQDEEAGQKTSTQLLIWPEYPVPSYYFDNPRFQRYIENLARRTETYVIFNTVAFQEENRRRPLNSAVTLSPTGELLSHYSKNFLVPFGEFVPWPFSLFIDKITLEAGDFVPGKEVVVTAVGEHKVGTFICYESVFARAVRRFPAQGAEVLVNISNDSWYGRSSARKQHLFIAQMRAIENRRWILRATNDGITSVVDPGGRVAAALPSFEQGALNARFDYVSEKTMFTRWGEWFWYLAVATAAAGSFYSRRREKSAVKYEKPTDSPRAS